MNLDLTPQPETRKNPLEVRFERIDPWVIVPTRASRGDAGYDLYSSHTGIVTLEPGQRQLFPTGIALAIPEGYVGLVKPRSGLALWKGIHVLGGVIDSGYRGDVGVILLNTSNEPQIIGEGERVAQLLIQPVMEVELLEVDRIGGTERGTGGFGSTGTH